jgi:hypothetical protein
MSKIQLLAACFLFVGMLFGGAAESQATTDRGNLDRVLALPGQPPVGFQLYAGNVTVDAEEGRDLFYVFAQCSNDASGAKPLVLWFNGGTAPITQKKKKLICHRPS